VLHSAAALLFPLHRSPPASSSLVFSLPHPSYGVTASFSPVFAAAAPSPPAPSYFCNVSKTVELALHASPKEVGKGEMGGGGGEEGRKERRGRSRNAGTTVGVTPTPPPSLPPSLTVARGVVMRATYVRARARAPRFAVARAVRFRRNVSFSA